MATTVLVTGVSTYLGAGVARLLAERAEVGRVIGVDVRSPSFPLGRAEFIRTDVRNPLLGRVLDQSGVDTIVHFGAVPSAGSKSARTSQREATVLGTMQLLGLAQAVPTLRHVVLASTGSVYGASAGSPSILAESAPVNVRARAGHVRDAIEVESYVRALERRRDDVGVSILRLTHVFGAYTRSAMSNYLRAPVVPVPFGFDARLQALHEDDAVGALVTAAAGPPVGTVNVAAEGILTLRQALRIAHRPSVPVWTTTGRALGALSRWAGISGVDPDHIDYVMFGRCLDVVRMREVLGFSPRLSTRETFEWFAQQTWGIAPGAGTTAPADPTPPPPAAASDAEAHALVEEMGDEAAEPIVEEGP